MADVIIVLFFFVLIVAVLLRLFICFHYFEAKDIKYMMNFTSFKKFYPINNDKWVLCEAHVMYNGMTCFRFNFIDYWRYRSWYKQQKRIKKNIAQNDALAAVIKDVKNYIA